MKDKDRTEDIPKIDAWAFFQMLVSPVSTDLFQRKERKKKRAHITACVRKERKFRYID